MSDDPMNNLIIIGLFVSIVLQAIHDRNLSRRIERLEDNQ